MADSNEITRSFFESLLLEMRHIGSGVAEKITSITNELKGVMSRTCFATFDKIDDTVIDTVIWSKNL